MTEPKYRTLSIRISPEEFAEFERVQQTLEKIAREKGIFTSMKKPDVLKHLIKSFFEQHKTDN